MPVAPPFSQEYLNANKGPQVLAIIITFPCLAIVVVSLRLYTRFKIVHNPSHDDFAILLALLFSIGTSICQAFQVYNGMGRHIQTLKMEQGINSLKALFASIMMYNFGLTLTKVSIILQYLRITIEKRVRRACWVLMAITVFHGVDSFFTGVFSCYPVAKFWDPRIPGGCVNKAALWYANAAINIIQDVWLVVMPIFILQHLILPQREKVSLILILGLGGFASLASVLRLHSLYILTVTKDVTWDNPGTATWSTVELNVGIICASLPTLRALVTKFLPNIFSSIGGGNQVYHRHRDQCGRGQFVHPNNTIFTLQTEGTIFIQDEANIDAEKEMGTFLASDSEAEGGVQPPQRI